MLQGEIIYALFLTMLLVKSPHMHKLNYVRWILHFSNFLSRQRLTFNPFDILVWMSGCVNLYFMIDVKRYIFNKNWINRAIEHLLVYSSTST